MLSLTLSKHVNALFCAAILFTSSISTAKAIGLAGSKHDMRAYGGEISLCAYCHAEHKDTTAQTPLWDRTESNQVFTTYSSVTMNDNMARPGAESLLCLSCHDGTNAFDALFGGMGTAGNNMSTLFPNSTAIIGSDLSDDHPIGVDIGLDFTEMKHLSAIKQAGLVVFNNKVECASCHDVHGRDGYADFLRLDPSRGSLCISCHNK